MHVWLWLGLWGFLFFVFIFLGEGGCLGFRFLGDGIIFGCV